MGGKIPMPVKNIPLYAAAKDYLDGLVVSDRLTNYFFLVTAFGFTFLNLVLAKNSQNHEVINYSFGTFLLAGLPNHVVTWSMPLLQIFRAATLELGVSADMFFVILHLGIYSLVFISGRLLGGYSAGIISLVFAGLLEAFGAFPYDAEQSFYSFFLLLLLALIIAKRGEGTLKTFLLAGLAAGCSLLIRSPLFLFPPFFLFLDWVCLRDRAGTFFARSLVFILASYVLLIPWGLLNFSVSGRLQFLDGGRTSCNVISAAKGSVYTMEGDAYQLARLRQDDSAIKYYFKEAAKRPLFFARMIIVRIWHIFLFYPVLLSFLVLAFYLSRETDRLLIFALPAYFILIHAPLSIESRYFYVLLYLAPPLIVGSLLPRIRLKAGIARPGPGKFLLMLSGLALCVVVPAVAVILVYPARAARNAADYTSLSRVIANFNGQRVLRYFGCARLREQGDDNAFYSCLSDYSLKFKDSTVACFLPIVGFTETTAVNTGGGAGMEGLIIRMLREFELDDSRAATASYSQAYSSYTAQYNMLRGEPYEQDRIIASIIHRDSFRFWDKFVYPVLLLWPPERTVKILASINRHYGLAPRMKELNEGLIKALALGEFGGRLAREKVFPLMCSVEGLPDYFPGIVRKESARQSKELSDMAVDAMRSGNFAEAEKSLHKALHIYAANPEALISLCSLRLREQNTSGALDACRSVSHAVEMFPENQFPGRRLLAAAAKAEIYRILTSTRRSR